MIWNLNILPSFSDRLLCDQISLGYCITRLFPGYLCSAGINAVLRQAWYILSMQTFWYVKRDIGRTLCAINFQPMARKNHGVKKGGERRNSQSVVRILEGCAFALPLTDTPWLSKTCALHSPSKNNACSLPARWGRGGQVSDLADWLYVVFVRNGHINGGPPADFMGRGSTSKVLFALPEHF